MAYIEFVEEGCEDLFEANVSTATDMNGTNGVGAPPALWSEARNAEGRVYYYNTVSKATQWTKPTELMTPAEVITHYFVQRHLMS